MFLTFIFIELFIAYGFAIHIYNAGNPHENAYSTSVYERDKLNTPDMVKYGEEYLYPTSTVAPKYVFPYGNMGKDYGILNMSLMGLQNLAEDLNNRKLEEESKRIGLYNVQTGDEFFLNYFDVKPKFMTKKDDNKQVLGYSYRPSQMNQTNNRRKNQAKPQKRPGNSNKPTSTKNPKPTKGPPVRPQTINRRKGNKTTTINRRKPNLQTTKPPRRIVQKLSNNNSDKNTNQKNKYTQTNKRKVQQNNCPNTNVPIKVTNNNRRPTVNKPTTNKKNVKNQNRKPVRKVNKNRFVNRQKLHKNNRRKVNNRLKNNQGLKSNVAANAVKNYLLKLRRNMSRNIDDTFDSEATGRSYDSDSRQRSLFSTALNHIKNQTYYLADKFLSLFTVVQYSNYQCIANSTLNYYEGTCYQEKQCLKLGGTPAGNCNNGYGVCCIFRSTCGISSNQNCTYFESPGYPNYFPMNISDTTPNINDYEYEEITGGGLQEIDDDQNQFITSRPDIDNDVIENFTEETNIDVDEYNLSDEFGIDTIDSVDILNIEPPEIYTQAKNIEELGRQINFAFSLTCVFRIFKASNNIQQMKIDFIDLDLISPENGDCIDERLVISGDSLNVQIPIICGYNSGQHIYVDVSTLSGPLQISVLSNEVFSKRYKIRICQLETPCVNSMNCLQYYTGVSGVISSFNYEQADVIPRSEPQYMNNLNYLICIRKEAGYCSTTFSNVDENNIEYEFDITNINNDETSLTVNDNEVLSYCPDDFILINNVRVCGTTFEQITDTRSGPIIIPVQTDDRNTGRGFKLLYRQNPCSN